MYIPEHNAFVMIRSRGKHPEKQVPNISLTEMAQARYVLFNNQDVVTSPLTFQVYKCRVAFNVTDFWRELVDMFPSIKYTQGNPPSQFYQMVKDSITLTDDSDMVRFLLMYGGEQ